MYATHCSPETTQTTLQAILEQHPALDAAFWRFCELDKNGGCNLASDILDAWHEGGFDAERLVREIEEERNFILSRE